MNTASKAESVESLKKAFEGVQSIVLADFRGINVETISAIRREFRKNDCHYRVVKNTLIRVAIADTAVQPMGALCKGPTALIWSTESASTPAKIAAKFAKDVEKFNIKGGFFDGQALDAAGVEQLAKMPGKQELQATLLMTFLAAPTDFVRLTAAAPLNFLYVLQARERALT